MTQFLRYGLHVRRKIQVDQRRNTALLFEVDFRLNSYSAGRRKSRRISTNLVIIEKHFFPQPHGGHHSSLFLISSALHN